MPTMRVDHHKNTRNILETVPPQNREKRGKSPINQPITKYIFIMGYYNKNWEQC